MAWRRPKPNTRISSCSIPTWRKPPRPRNGFAISITNRWTRRIDRKSTRLNSSHLPPQTQAEAKHKDFELFYPNMEEAAEAQERVCDIHYKQRDKAERDPLHAVRAEEECRQLLLQYPNSKFAPETQ